LAEAIDWALPLEHNLEIKERHAGFPIRSRAGFGGDSKTAETGNCETCPTYTQKEM